jgi:hypothetical protein
VLYAAAVPLVYLAASLINGVSGFGGLLLVLALCVVMFVPTYAFAELMLRYFGGEMDLDEPLVQTAALVPAARRRKAPREQGTRGGPPFRLTEHWKRTKTSCVTGGRHKSVTHLRHPEPLYRPA